MAEEIINTEEKNDVSTESDYIETIKQLKENTVPLDKYLSAVTENKKLIKALANGETLTTEKEQTNKPVDINQLRKDLSNPSDTNLEYVEAALKLREALMAQGEPDPFLPQGHKVSASNENVVQAQNVADVLQQCVDYAAGDSMLFTDALQRRLVDPVIPLGGNRNKNIRR